MEDIYIYMLLIRIVSNIRYKYSVHKTWLIVKPFIITSEDGYIIDVMGPYLAYGSNVSNHYTYHFFFWTLWKETTIRLVFRMRWTSLTIVDFKQKCIPTISEAHLSRCVTIKRWIEEAINGRLKKWRLLDQVAPNSLIPYIED